MRTPLHATTCRNQPSGADSTDLHRLVTSLLNSVDAKDPLSCNHSRKVAVASQQIALALGLDHQTTELIRIAGNLHDIGKTGLPDAILKKQGSLTSDEWQLMRKHPEIGEKIVRPLLPSTLSGGVADLILNHHEWYNGSGYPAGRTREEIPLGARIIAVADTLSALMEDRPYRRGTTLDRAVKEIQKSSGTQFDPRIVDSFMGVHGAIAASVI